jgi:oligopeptide transport system substrate-binding protein
MWIRCFAQPLFLAGLCSLLLLPLTHCARKEKPKDTAAPRYLQFNNTNEPEYLDPGLLTGTVEFNIAMALFEGLTTYDPKNGDPIPAVAQSWTRSKDGTRYTFALRGGAKWSDGRPLTAHDFVYAWERVLNPKTASEYAYILNPIRGAQDYNEGKTTDAKTLGFRAVNDTTLEVRLHQPAPYFLSLASFTTYMPVPRWAIEAHGAKWTLPGKIVSNGPFMLKSWTPYKEVVVTKNSHYWDIASVRLPGIRFHPIEDLETAFKMYEAGDLDVSWDVPVRRAPTLKTRPDFVQAPYFATYFYRLNTARGPLKDARVRQALALAIDRKKLVEQYLQGTEVASTSLVPVGTPGYVSPRGLGFDPRRASQLLNQAGYHDRSTFPVLTVHYDTNDQNKLVGQIVQQMWKEHLGIQIKLHNEEWKTYLKTQGAMNFDISRSRWIGDYIDAENFLTLFTKESQLNRTHWSDDLYEQLLKRAAVETDPGKRTQMLHKAESVLLEDAPVIPIFTYTKKMLVRPYVKGFFPNMQDAHPYKFVYLDHTAGAVGQK